MEQSKKASLCALVATIAVAGLPSSTAYSGKPAQEQPFSCYSDALIWSRLMLVTDYKAPKLCSTVYHRQEHDKYSN